MRALLMALALATPVAAQEARAPDYFVDTVVASALAQELALACTTLSINPATVSRASEDVLSRLDADGVNPAEGVPWEDDANARIETAITAFVEKYALADASEAQVCAAGVAEIAEGSLVGGYLLEVPA